MAHEIETAMYAKTGAWHGLGVVLDHAPSIQEALVASGLDWEVEARPLFAGNYSEFNGSAIIDRHTWVETGHRAIVRKGNAFKNVSEKVLGVVGSQYTPLQNSKAFEPFAPLVDAGLVELDAAGSLRGGQRVWILGKIKGAEAEVVKGDAVKGYMLFYNGHDGSLAASYQKTGIRVVCMNTLSLAMQKGEDGSEARMQFRHMGNINDQVDRLTEQFHIASDQFFYAIQQYQVLARKQCSTPPLYFRDVLRLNDPTRVNGETVMDMPDEDKQGKRQLTQLMAAFEEQPGVQYGRGSYWQAYNAVTYWIDHKRGRSEDARLNGSWFGDGRTIRNRAFDVAMNA